MAKIDKLTVDKIMDATNIVDVVSDFVSLKKRGSSYLGLCPFHNERTPSFSVSGSRGIFKCFSCGKAGTAVSFLMDLEGMSYVEALKWLGRKYNIEVKERELTSAEREADAARESMFAVNEFALDHFENTLHNTDDGRNIGLSYFRERGISDAMIKRFHLGYALERPADNLYRSALQAGFADKYIVETGLAIRTERGTVYDRFRGRVIYPVHTLSGRVVAFGGRTLRSDKEIAKYVNSPESTIYSKSRELYGLYQARTAMAKSKSCILVEGYMDVISMHQAGIENVVASSGTSLTDGQVRLIKRFADSVTLIYDADAAGIKASMRGIGMLLEAGFNLKVVQMPPGEDPDSYARSHTSTEVAEYLQQHSQDFIGFMADVLLTDSQGDPRRRTEAINTILQAIALIPDVVEQSLYLDECARKVGMDANILGRQLKIFTTKRAEELFNKRQAEAAQATIETVADNGLPTAPPHPADAPPSQPQQQQTAEPAVQVAEQPVDPAVTKAEEDLIKYVLRRGLMYLCDAFPGPEATEAIPMSVLDFIDFELRFDGITFATPLFRRIWILATELRDSSWPDARDAEIARLLAERQQQLDNGREQIRLAGGDTETIKKLDAQLEEQADRDYNNALDNFSAAYIRRMLLRSDDRSLTDQIARLTSDSVVLSRIYPKTDPRTELTDKLPIAICTLKSTLLKLELRRLTQLLAQPLPPQQLQDIMNQYMVKKRKSMEFDQRTGEIVITPGMGGARRP